MNKNDYIERISSKLNYTKKDVSAIIDELFELIKSDLKNKEKVMITNFGSFESVKTNPYNVYSPYDGSLLENVSQVRVHFKSSPYLKKYLSNINE